MSKEILDREAFKRAISHVESSGGKKLINPTTSASGKYHFLYNLIKNIPLLKGVTRREFINRPELQEKVMDMAIEGKLPGYPSYEEHALKIKERFNVDMDIHYIAALTHFLGAKGVTDYFSNPAGFKVPGKNASVQQYLDKFKSAFSPTKPKESVKRYKPALGNEIRTIDQDATDVAPKIVKTDTFDFKDSGESYIEFLNNEISGKNIEEVPQENIIEENENVQKNQEVQQVLNQRQNIPVSSELSGYEDPMNLLNQLAYGGFINSMDKEIVPIENGGKHENNPYGGVPMGVGENGQMNTVEEGEVKFGDYIFSNRLALGGSMNARKGGKMKDPTAYSDGDDLEKEKKVIGPQPGEDPLKFTKSENQYLPDGSLKKVSEEFVVEDVRDKYIYPEYISPDQNVNFNLAVKDKTAQEFLNRYNDPWTRSKLKEQANLSDEDIDNMILRGLNVKKELGGVDPKFKAKYDSETGTINMDPKFDKEEGVETHERVHASLFDAAQGDNLMKILGNPFRQETKTYLRDKDPNLLRYMQKPHEAYGNFTEFREKLGLKPGQKINKEELKKRIKSKNLSNENFIRVFDDDKVIEALNTIASVDTQPIEEYRIS